MTPFGVSWQLSVPRDTFRCHLTPVCVTPNGANSRPTDHPLAPQPPRGGGGGGRRDEDTKGACTDSDPAPLGAAGAAPSRHAGRARDALLRRLLLHRLSLSSSSKGQGIRWAAERAVPVAAVDEGVGEGERSEGEARVALQEYRPPRSRVPFRWQGSVTEDCGALMRLQIHVAFWQRGIRGWQEGFLNFLY